MCERGRFEVFHVPEVLECNLCVKQDLSETQIDENGGQFSSARTASHYCQGSPHSSTVITSETTESDRLATECLADMNKIPHPGRRIVRGPLV
jgi:hypothetical protein